MITKTRKNVSFDIELYEKLFPLIEKHNGNFSHSIRECVAFAEFAIEKIGSIERAKEVLIQNEVSDLNVGDKIILRVERVIRL